MAASSPERAPRVLIVLGMHRSGTSALAGTLARLGASAPATAMPESPDNPVGYYESIAFMDLNERVLASAGSSWDDWRPIPADWFAGNDADLLRAEVPPLLQIEFPTGILPVVKDPRISRLLPFWTEALARAGYEPYVLLCTRNPFEVARSLGVRDQIGRQDALLGWLRHSLDAEYASRGLPRRVVEYDALLRDWRGVADAVARDLDNEWPVPADEASAQIESFLRASLRHHVAPPNVVANDLVTRWATEAYACLRVLASAELATTGSDETAMATLDAIRSTFDAGCECFWPLLEDRRKRGEAAAELAATLPGVEAQVARQAREIAMLLQRLGALEAANAAPDATRDHDPEAG
jgi:hypothetical protein